jgi:hypothetical protein
LQILWLNFSQILCAIDAVAVAVPIVVTAVNRGSKSKSLGPDRRPAQLRRTITYIVMEAAKHMPYRLPFHVLLAAASYVLSAPVTGISVAIVLKHTSTYTTVERVGRLVNYAAACECKDMQNAMQQEWGWGGCTLCVHSHDLCASAPA